MMLNEKKQLIFCIAFAIFGFGAMLFNAWGWLVMGIVGCGFCFGICLFLFVVLVILISKWFRRLNERKAEIALFQSYCDEKEDLEVL